MSGNMAPYAESPTSGSQQHGGWGNNADNQSGNTRDSAAPPPVALNTSGSSSHSHPTATMDFDDLLAHLGEFGRYQKFIFFLVCMLSIPGALNNMGIVFLAAEPAFQCREPSAEHLNLSGELLHNLSSPAAGSGEDCSRQCHRYNTNYSDWTQEDVREMLSSNREVNVEKVDCQYGWVYNTSTYKSTIVTQWDLVCKHQQLIPTAASLYMTGLLVGVSTFGAISDWFGRKAALIPSTILMAVFSMAQPFANDYTTFVCIRFLLAASSIGSFTTAFVLGVELVGPTWRVFTGTVVEYFWVLGYLILGGVAYALRDWSHLALALAAPQALLIIIALFIPESPRWLYSRNKHTRGDVIVKKMARWNKVDLPPNITVSLQTGPQAYVVDLFKFPRLRWRTLIICYTWFVNSVVYYGLSLNTGNLGGNDFVNFLLSGVVEIPAYIFCQLALRYIGRRKTLVGVMLVGGAALLAILAVPRSIKLCDVLVHSSNPVYHNLRIALAMIGKLCIAASFAIIYIYSAELFPTVVRNIGVGLGSTCARVGGIIAPYILSIKSDAPYAVFGVMAIICGLLDLLLPETKNQQLPETIQDGENFPSKELKDKQGEDTLAPVLAPQTEPAYLYTNSGLANPAYSIESNI